MDLKLFDLKGQYITDIEVSKPYRDRQSGSFDVFGFDTFYRDIQKGYRIVVQTPQKDWQEYIVNYVEETHEHLTVQCENAFYETYGEYIPDRRPEGNPDTCLNVALEYSRWEKLKTVADTRTFNFSFYRCSVREAVSKILEATGLVIKTKVLVSGTSVSNRYVWLESGVGVNNGFRFEYGHNASNIKRTVEIDDVITSLYGFGRGEFLEETGGYGRRVDFAEINGGKQYVEDAAAVARYGKQIFAKIEFDDTEDRAEVLRRTKEELKLRVWPRVTYSGDVMDLGFDDTVTIDERGYLIDDILGIEVEGKVLRLVEYFDKSEPNKIELGNFTKTPESVKEKLTLQQIRETLATDPTRGGLEHVNKNAVQDMLATFNQQMNEGLLEGKVTYFPGGVIYESENSATYIGHLGWRIANTKNPDGTWNFKTIATGDGLATEIIGAEQMMGQSITGEHIKTGTFTTDHVSIAEEASHRTLTERLIQQDQNMSENFELMAALTGEAEAAANLYATELAAEEKARSEAYADGVLTLAEEEALRKASIALENAKQYADAKEQALIIATQELIDAGLSEVRTYITTDAETSDLLIGKAGNPIIMRLTNNRLSFEANGTEVAYFASDRLMITNAEFLSGFTLGRYEHQVKSDGGYQIVWV